MALGLVDNKDDWREHVDWGLVDRYFDKYGFPPMLYRRLKEPYKVILKLKREEASIVYGVVLGICGSVIADSLYMVFRGLNVEALFFGFGSGLVLFISTFLYLFYITRYRFSVLHYEEDIQEKDPAHDYLVQIVRNHGVSPEMIWKELTRRKYHEA